MINDITKNVTNILKGLDIQNIDSFENEINSITFIELIVDIETKYNIVVDEEYLLIEKLNSIDKICNYIESEVNKNEKNKVYSKI